ncbi:MAG: hypothetical protein Q9M91_04140 [Candidatus Dojkabacteria bacterium]|nr:hypothetical protein [Candidatus Dojkabacteria bacterium]
MIYVPEGSDVSVGLTMMHHYEQDGERVLVISMNPSSTFLYSTDEEAFFYAALDQVVAFAKANGFKRVAMSTNGAIRTNRTGGLFERAINSKF